MKTNDEQLFLNMSFNVNRENQDKSTYNHGYKLIDFYNEIDCIF